MARTGTEVVLRAAPRLRRARPERERGARRPGLRGVGAGSGGPLRGRLVRRPRAEGPPGSFADLEAAQRVVLAGSGGGVRGLGRPRPGADREGRAAPEEGRRGGVGVVVARAERGRLALAFGRLAGRGSEGNAR